MSVNTPSLMMPVSRRWAPAVRADSTKAAAPVPRSWRRKKGIASTLVVNAWRSYTTRRWTQYRHLAALSVDSNIITDKGRGSYSETKPDNVCWSEQRTIAGRLSMKQQLQPEHAGPQVSAA